MIEHRPPRPAFARLGGRRRLVAGVATLAAVLVGAGLIVVPRMFDPEAPLTSSRDDVAMAALAELRSASSTPVQVRFEGGVATSVLATVKVRGETPEAKALDFLARMRGLYGLGAPEIGLQSRESVSLQDGRPDAAIFQQTYRGIPVSGAEIAVYSKGDTILGSAGSTVLGSDLALDVEPAITGEAAGAAALGGRIGAVTVGDPDLAIFDPARFGGAGSDGNSAAGRPAVTLAWRIRVRAGGTAEDVYIDAATGRVLLSIARDLDVAPVSVSSLNNQTSARDSLACAEFKHEYLSPLNTEFLAAHRIFARIESFYVTQFGRSGWDGDGGEIHVHIDARITKDGEAVSMARFLLDCGVLEFSPGWISDGTTEYLGIAAHEFQHGVTRTMAPGGGFEGWWIPGALNESYGDVFAMFIMGDPILEKPTGNRDLSNPNGENAPDRWSELYTPANYCGPDAEPCDQDRFFPDSGWIHSNRGIPNMAAYLLWNGGTHPDTKVQVNPVPRGDLYRLYFDSLLLMPTHADFWTQRTVLEILSFGSADRLCSVRNAFAAVEIGAPDQDCNGILDPIDDPDGDGVPAIEDNCPTDANPVQYDRDGDGLGVPCDLDLDGDGIEEHPSTGVGDNCPNEPNPDQGDLDQDGIGAACDSEGIDIDSDGIRNTDDNCLLSFNPRQEDTDRDGEGDACDPDDDGDGVSSDRDNCPYVANGDQADRDGDKLGNACDTCPTTADNGLGWTLITYIDPAGNIQSVFVPQVADSDGDGTTDACDPSTEGDRAAIRMDSGPIQPPTSPGSRADLVISGDIGGSVALDIALCALACATPVPPDACVEARLSGVDSTTRVSILDDSGNEVARALGDADPELRWSPDSGRTYELAFERLEGASGEDRLTATTATCTLGERIGSAPGASPSAPPTPQPIPSCVDASLPGTASLEIHGDGLDGCWALEDGTDLSPADELIAAVWTVVETDPSGTFADLVSLSMSGPIFEGTERTSQSGIGLGFAVSRDTDQGTTAFSHVFSSRSGECEVTMYPTSTGVAGTFACDGIADADGRIFNARGSFATGTT